MQNVVDEERIRKGARIGKIALVASLVVMAGAVVVSLALPMYLWISLLCAMVGLLMSGVATANMNRWWREPRADQALAQALKGFDDRYQLYSYYLPAPHVFLTPLGIYVLTALGQDGKIHYDGTKFRRDFSLGRVLRFMGEEGLGRPFAEAAAQVQAIKGLLAQAGLDDEVGIQNVIVFFNPRAQLDVVDPPVPVVTPKDLKKTIRKLASPKLSMEQYRRIEELFDETADLELVEE